jgi:F-type H+-transporting ATPase subunit epsilon
MRLQILTPEKTAFDGEAESVLAPGESGVFEVLKDHAPILAALAPGDVRVVSEKKELHFHVGQGFLEFNHNRGVILADSAERPGEINLARARAAQERARKRLAQSGVNFARAQKALMRALSREKFQEKFPGGESGGR